jgi:hypothetical protein
MLVAVGVLRQAFCMSGVALLGLILLSMAWLFFLLGLAINLQVYRKRKARRPVPGLGFLPGVVGSLAVFFTVPALARYGVEVPLPWLWILLPLVLDPYCLGWLVMRVLERR